MMKMMPQRAAILIGSVLFLLLLSASQSVAEEKGKAAALFCLFFCFDLKFGILYSISSNH